MTTRKTPLQPPVDDADLARAYRTLCSLANEDGIVPDKPAHRELGRRWKLSYMKTHERLIVPLSERGYIRALANVEGDRVWKLMNAETTSEVTA